MVVPAPVSGSFHAKIWLIIGEDDLALLVGSGNLTQAGFMTNAEFFDALHFTADTPAPPGLLASIRSFVKGLSSMWPTEDSRHLLCVETLSQIERAISEVPTTASLEDKAPRFLHSFQGPLIEQMPEVPDAEQLYVAAPFFGHSLRGLSLLTGR